MFISDSLHACLADFGLSVVGDVTGGHLTTTKNVKGSLQWTAPERIRSYAHEDPPLRRAATDDVYAFGCLGIEASKYFRSKDLNLMVSSSLHCVLHFTRTEYQSEL